MDLFLEIDIFELIEELNSNYTNRGSNPKAFSRVKSTNGNVMCCCPFHSEDRPSFGIEEDYPYRYNCFTCGAKGDLISLISHSLNLNRLLAYAWLTKAYKVYSSNSPKIKKSVINPFDIHSNEIEIPSHLLKTHPSLYERGFKEEVLRKFKIGFDEVTSSILIPIWDRNGKLSFIKRRFLNAAAAGNMYFNEEQSGKSDIIYLLNFIKDAGIRRIKLVEGEFDALACYQAGIPAGAIMTNKISDGQVMALRKAGINTVDLFLDNDKWGRIGVDYSIEKLSPYMRVNKVVYPANLKDPNDLLKAGLLNKVSFKGSSLSKKLKDF